MAKPFSLQMVLDLMRNRHDEATQSLARLLAAERDAKKKLEMLLQYREEYTTRFREAAQDGLGQPEWRNFQEFLNRLDEAITQQLQSVSLQEAHTAAGQAEWRQQQKRLKAFDALSERHRASEARWESRQEQKTQDEFAARHKSREEDR
ncbi:flagellar export protein FliJ [Candidatus Accumulibacter vicinus]|uniref:Flagellar FliJ protein n=1 Tax=Candidatus Accumulibacter vicinus TaxID=2954382 RepID=A0A084XWW8_9PROT|nr:flagellar export protein FliJ [Candidatus Accumulibacter vicinus]KFB66962.1 MAG: Flagellar FliJ protein [Candidatus Accumulibacter vicinus]